MPIVSSVLAANNPQKDGHAQVLEIHTDALGIQHSLGYLADGGTDLSAVMLARIPGINASLIAAEISANVQQGMTQGANATLTFNESTIQQNVEALAATFPSATIDQLLSMTAFLLSLPPAMVAATFGLTTDQLTALEQTNTALSTAVQELSNGLQLAIQGALNG